MKLSDAIYDLIRLEEEHGKDLEIYCYDGLTRFEIKKIGFEDYGHSFGCKTSLIRLDIKEEDYE